jgi:hypothetical protein
MGKQEWQMTNAKWQMTNAKWQMTNGSGTLGVPAA